MTEINFHFLYNMYECLADALTKIGDGDLTIEQLDGVTMIETLVKKLGTAIGLDKLLNPDDVQDYERVRNLITGTLHTEDGDEIELLFDSLETYFADVKNLPLKSKWGIKLARQLNREWFKSHRQAKLKGIETPTEFLTFLEDWLGEQIREHEAEAQDSD